MLNYLHPPCYGRAGVVSKELPVLAFQLLALIVTVSIRGIITKLLQFCRVIMGNLLNKEYELR